MMVWEWFDTWSRYYLPDEFPVNGKTVLNVGAGEGETAAFFFSKGAKKFICVEPDASRAGKLLQNTERNGWNCTIIQGAFSNSHLTAEPFDFMEMDCEGCEASLLDPGLSPPLGSFPCTIEVHAPEVLASFLRNDHFYLAKTYGSIWIVKARAASSGSRTA